MAYLLGRVSRLHGALDGIHTGVLTTNEGSDKGHDDDSSSSYSHFLSRERDTDSLQLRDQAKDCSYKRDQRL